MTELERCPFCGGEAAYSEYFGFNGETWHYAYVCDSCGATPGLLIGIGGDYVSPYRTKEEAAIAWNKRVERTCTMTYDEEWSGDELYPTAAFVCSECGGMTVEGVPNYCPNCGARVRSEA